MFYFNFSHLVQKSLHAKDKQKPYQREYKKTTGSFNLAHAAGNDRNGDF